jgi:hypothetical protein
LYIVEVGLEGLGGTIAVATVSSSVLRFEGVRLVYDYSEKPHRRQVSTLLDLVNVTRPLYSTQKSSSKQHSRRHSSVLK